MLIYSDELGKAGNHGCDSVMFNARIMKLLHYFMFELQFDEPIIMKTLRRNGQKFSFFVI